MELFCWDFYKYFVYMRAIKPNPENGSFAEIEEGMRVLQTDRPSFDCTL